MRIGINDHIDGTERVDPSRGGTRAAYQAGERARGLERLRRRLDHPRRVLLRDFIIFEFKQLLDSFKGLVVSQVAVVAFLIDLMRPGGRSFGLFYRVLDVGERFDIWISLYGASRHAAENPEGLLGESREGSPTLLGQLEHVVHRVIVGEHPEQGQGGELYPRQRRAGAPAPDADARPWAHATAGNATGAREPAAPGAEPGNPAPADAVSPRPAPAQTSSFEAENFGSNG